MTPTPAMTITAPSTDTDSPNANIDRAIKGSPSIPLRSIHSSITPSSLSPSPPPPSITSRAPPAPPVNPLDTAPSSPSQVYLNLLILEASLRSQYLHHLARRRKFTFFLLLLFCWIAFFVHRIYFLGGSPYYYVSHFEWLGLLGGSVTGALYYATGLYQNTIVEPRRFFSLANRGLRGFNVKLVKVPFSTRGWIFWWWHWYTFHPPPPPPRAPPSRRLSANTAKPRRLSSNARRPGSISSTAMGRTPSLLPPHAEEPTAVADDPDDEIEEYLPGGLHLKLIILPKRFSADFREGWELYRAEYWERENEARVVRRREAGGWWLWSRKPKPKANQPHQSTAPPSATSSPAGRTRRPSVSSRAGTPEPEAATPGKRRGSLVAKRRPNMAPGLGGVLKGGDVSDSGSASGAAERRRRSESPITDRSSSSAGTTGKRKGARGKGRGKKPAVAGGSGDG